MNIRHDLLLSSGCAVAILAIAGGADWLQFRGPDNASVTRESNLPVQWTADDAAWSIALPGRCVSGPIVVGDHIVTTSSSGQKNQRLHIWCVDKQEGTMRWQRNLWASGRTLCHPLTSMASPTPASDGTNIYVLFASNDLVCLDLEGSVRWMRALGSEHPQAFDDRGLGSSPLLADGTLVLQVECQGDSFALGIDSQTGRTRWHLPLPKKINWLSPTTLRQGDRRLAMLQTSDRLLVLDPKSGEILATYETPGNSISSPVADRNMVFMPSKGLTALEYRPGADTPRFVWQENRLGAQSSSPVVGGGKVYVIRSPNILACGDAATGKELWRLRLRGQKYWATPILTPTHLYAVSAEGLIQVADIRGDKPELVAQNDMHEEILGSPAVSDGAIYLRGVTHLWKINRGR